MRAKFFIGLLPIFILIMTVMQVRASDALKLEHKLVAVWQTEQVLEVPESVLWDDSGKTVYVSNISGKPLEKNGAGFISKMSLDGKITVLKWAVGLNAPKGMAIIGKHLFVSDIDRVVKINMDTGAIEATYPAPGALFLNDVAGDADGSLYVSDSSSENSMIYKLNKGKMNIWIKNKQINRPNGLFMEGDRLLVGNGGDGCIKAVDMKSGKITTIAKVGSGIDGLQPAGDGNYLVSDWLGKTSLITASKNIELMDTTGTKINSADFAYIKNKALLLIPTFFDNRVAAYRLE